MTLDRHPAAALLDHRAPPDQRPGNAPQRRPLRTVSYQPRAGCEEHTIAGWLVRAVLTIPASVDAGQAAAALGVSPRQVHVIRDRRAHR